MEQSRRRRQGADAWRAVLARYADSGVTVAAFCEREGINAASFYQWRSKLAGVASKRATSSPGASEPVATAGFVDLGTLTTRASGFELRLDLGEGVVLHLSRG